MHQEKQFIIHSNANMVEEIMGNSIQGISSINYVRTDSGNKIEFELHEGYTAVSYDSLEKVTITIFKKSTSGKKRIVIDAGHGGKDPGAVANGLEEKEVVLDVSLRLQKLLEEAGYEVLMTRGDDTFLELKERVELANGYSADAFISVHANAATNVNANGTETFWNSTNSGKESKLLGEYIHKQLVNKLGTTDRGLKEANFQVIRNTKMPSVLVELGFITNKKDAELLATNEIRQRSAEAMLEGVQLFFQ